MRAGDVDVERRDERTGRGGSPAARAAAAAAALVALLALVAAASGARGGGSIAAAPRALPIAVFDYVFTFSVVLIVAAFLSVFLLRRPGAGPPRRERGLLANLVVAAMAIAVAFLFHHAFQLAVDAGLLAPRELSEQPRATPRTDEQAPPGSRAAEFRVGPALVLAAGLAALMALHLVQRRRRRRAAFQAFERSVSEELAVLLDDTLDDLRAERDARRAVIAAYARMEQALAAHGLARRPSEAPLEYLTRVLHDLRVPAAAALDLTSLFERAKFSPHPIDAEMKDEAIDALVTVRDDLRAAA